MRPQSKTQSAIEVIISTAIGFAVSVLTGWLLFPCYGLTVSLFDNVTITAVFTVTSLVRGYFVRRIFNRIGG